MLSVVSRYFGDHVRKTYQLNRKRLRILILAMTQNGIGNDGGSRARTIPTGTFESRESTRKVLHEAVRRSLRPEKAVMRL